MTLVTRTHDLPRDDQLTKVHGMTTYNTPDLIEQLTTRLTQLEERVEALETNKKPQTMSAQHALEMEAIMEVFNGIPVGFELSIPAIAKNIEGVEISRDSVTTRVYTLVKAGKLKRHQEGNEHPTFSRLP